MTEKSDTHSKIILAIVGMVVIFAIVALVLSQKPAQTKAGQPASVSKDAISSPYKFTSKTTGSLCVHLCSFTVTFSPDKENHHCPGDHTMNVEMNCIVDWAPNPGVPRPSGCPKYCMDSIWDPDGDGTETKDSTCSNLLTEARSFCDKTLCTEQYTKVKNCRGKLSRTWDLNDPYKDCTASRTGDCSEKASWSGLTCTCYIEVKTTGTDKPG